MKTIFLPFEKFRPLNFLNFLLIFNRSIKTRQTHIDTNYKKINSINDRGGITIDFIFALTLIMGFAAVLLSLSLTLTLVSITQYVSFVSARAMMLGHHSSDEQVLNGQKQFMRLYQSPILAPLYNGGWFELKNPALLPKVGDIENFNTGFPEVNIPGTAPNLLVGFTVNFVARILDFEIPFFGSTSDTGGDGSGFQTTIASFLSKEPSVAQCRDFNLGRWKAIRKLNVPGGVADYSSNTSENGAVWWINDNGC